MSGQLFGGDLMPNLDKTGPQGQGPMTPADQKQNLKDYSKELKQELKLVKQELSQLNK